MKKIILFAAILFAGISTVLAQAAGEGVTGLTTSAETDLTVRLNPIHTITVNNPGILLNYLTTGDYISGVTSVNSSHLTIYSTGNFQVTVKAENDFQDAPAGMDVGTISITANKNGATATESVSKLRATDSDVLIASTEGVFGGNYDVTYKGGTAYANLFSKSRGEAMNEFKTNVLYTIVPL